MEEDIDVKDMVGLDINMHEKVTTNIPENIFEDVPANTTLKKAKIVSPVKIKIQKRDSTCSSESYHIGLSFENH